MVEKFLGLAVLNDLVADIVQMTDKFEYRAINLEVVPFPVRIKAEWNQLIHVLSHLISNAVKYSDVDDLVTLQLTQANGWTIIQVRDKSDGIPLSQQSRIFEPLYQVNPSRACATGKAGLGLSIVKHLAEGMGGKVAILSDPGLALLFSHYLL